jgi:hypothetical protein
MNVKTERVIVEREDQGWLVMWPIQGQGILTPVCRYHAASLTRLGREVRKL